MTVGAEPMATRGPLHLRLLAHPKSEARGEQMVPLPEGA